MIKLNNEIVTPKWLAGHLEYGGIRTDDPVIVKEMVEKVRDYGFHAIFAPSYKNFDLVHELLEGTDTIMATALNYPAASMSSYGLAKEAEYCYKKGCRTTDFCPDLSAFRLKDYKKVIEGIKAVVDNFGDGEVKVFCNCTGSIEDMMAMADCIEEAGASHLKTYDDKGAGVPIDRIQMLRKRLTNTGLKASGNGRHWSGAIILGTIAAGADYISAGNAPQVVAELPYFEEIYSKFQFEK